MRLWSIHPSYLDAAGLVALWREGLLARKVLCGRTKGYTRHPQLIRFRETPDPVQTIDAYLKAVHEEASHRGYRFDDSKISPTPPTPARLPITTGQMAYEFRHLLNKLQQRSPGTYTALRDTATIRPHPLFIPIPGGICAWEVTHAPS